MKKIWIAAALLSCCLFSGCSPMVKEGAPRTEAVVEDSAHYPVTVETLNSHGEMREETFRAPPKRVVCIWQNSIENLLALGVGDRIVAAMGLPDGSYLRPEYRDTYAKIPYTSMEHLDMETVMLQDPDLIVGWASSFDKKTLRGTDFWEGRGVGTYIAPGSSSKIQVHTIDYEYQDILNLGKIFDREEKAQELVSKMQDEIERAEGKAQKHGASSAGAYHRVPGEGYHGLRRTLAGRKYPYVYGRGASWCRYAYDQQGAADRDGSRGTFHSGLRKCV